MSWNFLQIHLLEPNSCYIALQTAGDISLYMYTNKTKSARFKQGGLSTLKKKASEISRPVPIHRQQYLIYWNQCQQKHRENVDWYWQVVDYMEIWTSW